MKEVVRELVQGVGGGCNKSRWKIWMARFSSLEISLATREPKSLHESEITFVSSFRGVIELTIRI